MNETRRLAMRRKHAERAHKCKFCGQSFSGNGGYASHMRKEYFERMPDMKDRKWIAIQDLRSEWNARTDVAAALSADSGE